MTIRRGVRPAPARSTARSSSSTGALPGMRSIGSSSPRRTAHWKRRLRVVEALGHRRDGDPRDLAVPPRDRLDARDRRPACSRPTIRSSTSSGDPTTSGSETAPGLWVRPGRRRCEPVGAPLPVGQPDHVRAPGLVLPWNDGTWTLADGRREAVEPTPGPAPRRPVARRRLPRRLLVRAALPSGPGRGGVTRRARPCRRAVRVRSRPWCPEIF